MNHPLHARKPLAALAKLLGAALCVGCLARAPAPAPATAEPSQQPSATIVFPTPAASPTLTPVPSLTPTLDLRAQLGELIFQDTFADDQGWSLATGPSGTASLLPGRLVLSVRRSGAVLQSLSPAPAVADFYLQAEVRTELCGQADEFGLMFRALPNSDHYRFSLTCDGQARVSRLRGGQEDALAPLTPTAAALPGAPASNRMAVFARGAEMRFLVNEVEVFSLRDATLPSGGFGVAVRSRRSPQATVSFLSFAIYALAPGAGSG